MNKKYAVLVVFVVLAGATFFFFKRSAQEELRPPFVTIGKHAFSVGVARTKEEQDRGLVKTDTVCRECGMLFKKKKKNVYRFWMKDMRFPIDILWIREGKIVHIEEEVDFKDQKRIYAPSEPADSVLEINAGLSRGLGIKVGQTVSVSLFSSSQNGF